MKRVHTFGVIAGLTFALLAVVLPAQAAETTPVVSAKQQKSVAFGKKLYLEKANCVFCHGWAADGRGHERSQVGAPSLRTTELDRETLEEVIRCGRPGTGMPFHDRFAYTDDRCYGSTREDMGKDLPPASDRGLQSREILSVIDYLEARIIGKPPITVAECVEFWGRHNTQCDEVATLEKQRAAQTN
ncbi:MAG: cytochrome c [Proteobacteria bacterium]|nr:cytochrome c [Pseudomonadota bacterium]MDA1059749.1 cytochrome c [Pseudomonadota bacterium]